MTPAPKPSLDRNGGVIGKAFAQRVRVAMAAKHVTMREVATACGVSANAVAGWANGRMYPKSSTLVALCRFLGCSLDWIMSPDPLDMQGRPYSREIAALIQSLETVECCQEARHYAATVRRLADHGSAGDRS